MINAGHQRSIAPRIAAVVASLAVALSACGDDPFQYKWSDAPHTAKIYSIARPELNIPTAFSFYDSLAFPVEAPLATGRWDMALDTRDGSLVLLPPGALGVSSNAGIAAYYDTPYGEVTQAPSDTLLYEEVDPVPVVAGTTYIIRTGLRPGSFGSTCTYYGKMAPLEIDVAGGSLTFQYVTSPICNSRDLVPPD